jgi:hypothetical protein
MGVPVESAEGLTLPRKAVAVRAVTRGASGVWTLTLDVDATFTLPDGRVLTFAREVLIRGKQAGRKRSPREWKPWLSRKARA